MTTPHHQKILQVRYRTPRHTLAIFWAEDAEDFDFGIRFVGCRIMRIVTSTPQGMPSKDNPQPTGTAGGTNP